MKKQYFTLFSFVLLVSFTFLKCSDDIINPTVRELTQLEKQVVTSSGEFGFKLFDEISKEEKNNNVFISPLSVSMALGMALNGAAGSTYEAMKTTLGFNSITQQQINESYKSLISLLTQIDPKVRFDIANSIWYRRTMNFEQEFVDVNKKYFNAEVEGLDFDDPNSVDVINNWVSKSTNDKIKTIIDEIPSTAIMYLINAIYFKGTWKYEFNKESTRDDIFAGLDDKKISCKMMAQKNKFLYYHDNEIQLIDLPYGNNNFSMTIILPNYDENIEQVIGQLNKTKWNNWLNKLNEQEGIIQLPKFKFELKYLLNKSLEKLGMEIAFTKQADFTKLYKPGNVLISNVTHKTYVKVDEEGTEAAAVTSVGFGATSVGDDNGFIMRVDRPFVFVIREKNSGSILFIGKVVEPKN